MSADSLALGPRTENLTGREFGVLEVIAFAGYKRGARWLCRCRCGKEKVISAHELKRGHSVSCGCGIQQKKEVPVESRPEFGPYMAMLSRCFDPNNDDFARYGGRGVTVCERWRRGFWFFFEDMGPRPSALHSLDRFPDKDGDYTPGNVRWATPKQQGRNRRTNRLIEFRGRTQSMAEWAEELGIPYVTLKTRLNRLRWTVEDALATPIAEGTVCGRNGNGTFSQHPGRAG